MGMDVYGKKPTSGVGEYFRNNVWWWRPLADYILNFHPDIAKGCQYWHTNDGDGLNATDAKKLGEALLLDIQTGVAQARLDQREALLRDLPMEKCELCNGTGVRTDAIGVSLGMDKEKRCNGCDSTGQKEPFARQYPASIENIQEFADFAIASGGFEIC